MSPGLILGRDVSRFWGCLCNQARQKLDHVNTLDDVVRLLRDAKKVVVLAGAGISVACGIPDFRSENGIYSVRWAGIAATLNLCDLLTFFAFAASWRVQPPGPAVHVRH